MVVCWEFFPSVLTVIEYHRLICDADSLLAAYQCSDSSPSALHVYRYSGKEGFFPAAYLRKADSLKAKQLLEMNRQPSAIVASAPTNGLNERSQLSHYAPPRRDANKPKPVTFHLNVVNYSCNIMLAGYALWKYVRSGLR